MCEVFRKGYSPCGKWFFDAMKAEHGAPERTSALNNVCTGTNINMLCNYIEITTRI